MSINIVVISTRLTTSPCLIVSDSRAWTANMERLMSAQNSVGGENFMAQYMKTQKRVRYFNELPLLSFVLLSDVYLDRPSKSTLSTL